MNFIPHKYQEYAINFMATNPISALLLECGTGKTGITLMAIRNLHLKGEISHVLVVAPKRVAESTWSNEIEKFEEFKGLEYQVAVGTQSKKIKAINKRSLITIIARDSLDWLINKSGLPFIYDFVVLDELSSYKQYKSNRTKSLLKVRHKIKRITGLTGTPCPNGMLDLFSEYLVLDGGARLGRYITNYRDKYFVPNKRNRNIIFSYKLKPFAEDLIYKQISDITISMKTLDYIKMPELIINNIEVEMGKKEREKYDALKKDMVVSIADTEIDAVNAAVLSNKLLQLANGCIYGDNKEVVEVHNKKLDALEDLIEASLDKPLLIFYWFQSDGNRIRERFKVKDIETKEDIDEWNKGNIPVALAQIQSCSFGLNLQYGSNTMVFYSLCWSLEQYEQCCARLYRQGQKGTVYIHHIICKDTIDEDVIKALENKEVTQNALIDAVKAEVRK